MLFLTINRGEGVRGEGVTGEGVRGEGLVPNFVLLVFLHVPVTRVIENNLQEEASSPLL